MGGNPNPDMSGLKPFQPGQSGNPGGKTKEQRAAEVKAAEDAAILRAMMTASLLEKVKAGADVASLIDPAVLRLLKDSEDRAHGTPKQSVEQSGPDGQAIPISLNVGFKSTD